MDKMRDVEILSDQNRSKEERTQAAFNLLRSLQKYPNFSKRTLKERNLAFIASANFAKRFIQSSLLENQDEDALEALVIALQTDPSPIVRHECAFVLGDKKKPYLGKYLAKAVKEDSSNIVVHEALSALGTLGDPSYIPFIREYLNHPDIIVSETAEMAIERITKYKGGKSFV